MTKSTTVALGGWWAGRVGAAAPISRPSVSQVLRVGLIGCGGRGTGAAAQALGADSHARLVAMGDAFPEKLASSLEILQKRWSAKVDVPPARRFVGLDAYRRVLESGVDVVLLATPPGFRPEHLRAAIAADKHVFCEKPVAVDAPGVRAVLASAAEAKKRGLAVVSGFCWRYDDGMREYMKRLQDGAIGEIRCLQTSYYTGRLSTKFPGTREAGWGDLEWQMRNWYNFRWLSGDHLVEQAVHNVDRMAWAMSDQMPLRAIAVGGREIPAYGNTFDHFYVTYEFANGARGMVGCRQQDGCHNYMGDYMMGSDGIFDNPRLGGNTQIRGKTNFKYTGKSRNMFEAEHEELFASIRSGNPINDGVKMAHSSLMAIMGRMAAYTGQAVTWEQALNSQVVEAPGSLSWESALEVPPRAIPGKTKLI